MNIDEAKNQTIQEIIRNSLTFYQLLIDDTYAQEDVYKLLETMYALQLFHKDIDDSVKVIITDYLKALKAIEIEPKISMEANELNEFKQVLNKQNMPNKPPVPNVNNGINK